jgi:acyl-coenzyme A thioesterase PaaI-like protein
VSEGAAPSGFHPLSTGGAFLARAGRLFVRESGHGTCEIGVRIEQAQSNSQGFAHGGFLLTLVDIALSLATRGEMLSLSNDFLRPARSGDWIVARAQVQKSSRILIFADASVSADDVVLLRAQGLYRPRPAEPRADAPRAAIDRADR